MIVILAFDGLEYEYVKRFGCKNLMQESFGKTDISDFTEPRTIVIWSSFLSGRNTEKEILSMENFWDFRLKPEETFFSGFNNFVAIDVPGFTFVRENHAKERQGLKDFFEKKMTVEEFDKIAFENHKKTKKEFFDALDKGYEIVMGYFGLADVIGHLSFGVESKMKIIYTELDEIARTVNERADIRVLIISDHGMKAVGRFGDHSNYGFWSLNNKVELQKPKITDFYGIIKKMKS
ncbi:MAG: hypothetical protein ACE5J7_05140 [Candidatus Aenigmatarchaeota archaeon]